MGVLSQVDRGQMEAERLDAAQQALHREHSPHARRGAFRRLAMTTPRSRSSSSAAA